MNIIKEMEYTTEKTIEVLAQGEMMGFEWFVISYGTHPCCYIRIPEGHEFFGIDYWDIEDVYCHGGLTFSNHRLLSDMEDGWYIGWDYNHLGDCNGKTDPYGKKYSVSMLIADVTETICDL